MPIFNYHGIKEAQVGSGRNYIGVGDFVLKCQSIQEGTNHVNEVYFEAVFEVIQSTNQQQPTGAIVCYYQKLTGNTNSLGNLKAFLGAIIGKTPMDVDQNDVEYCLGMQQPLANRYVMCRGRETIIGKNNPQNPGGREWTVYDWFPVQEQPVLEIPAAQPQSMQPVQPQQPMQGFTPPQQQPMQGFTPPQQQQPMQGFTPPQQQPAQPQQSGNMPNFNFQPQQPVNQPQMGTPPAGQQPQALTGWKPM